MLKSFFKTLSVLAFSCVLIGCGEDDPQVNWGNGGNTGAGGNSALNTYKGVAKRMETPALKPGNLLLSHWSKEGKDSVMTYCLEYSFSAYHSRWVAFRFDSKTRPKNVSRKDYDIDPQYPIDPYLKKYYTSQALPSDALRGSGYNHGHLVASADRLYSRVGNDNTFFMTNMSPQISRFNSPYWSGYEALVQNLGRNTTFADTLYVAKGGTIESGQTLKRVADNRMVVPKYYFMAILKVKKNAYTSIAFWMEHKDYGKSTPTNSEMASKAISVNHLEQLSGIDFFPNLPDLAEEKIEDACNPGDWNL